MCIEIDIILALVYMMSRHLIEHLIDIIIRQVGLVSGVDPQEVKSEKACHDRLFSENCMVN